MVERRRVALGEYQNGMSDGIQLVFDEWMLDVTQMPREHSFVPVINGIPEPRFRYSSERCPGDLIGVYHSAGSEAANSWKSFNPGWQMIYRQIG